MAKAINYVQIKY